MGCAGAYRAPESELRGRVVDEAGAPLAGARVQVRSERGTRILFTDASGEFALEGLLAGPFSTLAVEASYAERIPARIEGIRLVIPAVPIELVLETGRPFEVELVEESGGPAPVTYLAAERAGIKTAYARAAGDGRFAFERLPAGEIELVTNVGGRVHRFRARVEDERARFTLPDHGALEIALGAGRPDHRQLRARVTLPGVSDFEHLAEIAGPIALQPGSYLLELVHERWIDGERELLVLDGPRALAVRAHETTRAAFGN